MKMQLTLASSSLFVVIFVSLWPSPISSQACQRSCGNIPIKYPFGTGTGCGDPRFRQYVTCNDQKLTLTTHTGCYPITDIDYNSQVIYLSDPSMSTCACNQKSKGFGLDWQAPFSFKDDNIFALLDCSVDSSPIFKSNSYSGGNSSVPLCDKQGVSICSFLYSCKAISMLNLPISTCCVYTPVDLGPAFEMDLQKLQCNSYAGFYSFNGQETNPDNWKYGISLKYKFNVYDDYPSWCASCEKTNGACGYGGTYNSFVCNCPNGINTTRDCFFGYSNGLRSLPWQTGTVMIYTLALFLVFIL